MASVYPAKITLHAIPEIVNKHNLLVDLIGKNLSSVVEGGGVGDVKSPVVPGSTDGFVPLWDGDSGKLLKNSLIDGAWFNQGVTTLDEPSFATVSATSVLAGNPLDPLNLSDTPLYVRMIDGKQPAAVLMDDDTSHGVGVFIGGLAFDGALVLLSPTQEMAMPEPLFAIDLQNGGLYVHSMEIGDYILPDDLDDFSGPALAQTMTEMTGMTIDDTWRDWTPEGIDLVGGEVYQIEVEVEEGTDKVIATGSFIWSDFVPAVEWSCELPLHQLSLYATGGKNIYIRTLCDGTNPCKLQIAGSAAFTAPVVNAKFLRIM